MERLEQILKWSWLAVPFMFAGWTALLIEGIGLPLISVLLVLYAEDEIDDWKYPITHYTLWFSWLPACVAQVFIWLSWLGDKYEPLFYQFLSEFTILHWLNILG